MTVKLFLDYLVKNHPEQLLKVLSADESIEKSEEDTISNNDVLIVTSQIGSVKQYKIVVGD